MAVPPDKSNGWYCGICYDSPPHTGLRHAASLRRMITVEADRFFNYHLERGIITQGATNITQVTINIAQGTINITY